MIDQLKIDFHNKCFPVVEAARIAIGTADSVWHMDVYIAVE